MAYVCTVYVYVFGTCIIEFFKPIKFDFPLFQIITMNRLYVLQKQKNEKKKIFFKYMTVCMTRASSMSRQEKLNLMQ